MRNFVFSALVAVSAVAGSSASVALAQTTPAEDASSIVETMMQEAPIPAVSVAVYRDDGLVWSQAFGNAHVELGVAAQTDHRFRLGSVSKIITASLAARLVDRGVIDLDVPISTYRDDLPAAHQATTLRQLLGHQGGVRHYNGADFNPASPGSVIDLRVYPDSQTALNLFINDPLAAEPGSTYSYSTFGYTLIAAVMESATGESFRDLVRQEVAEALDLPSLGADTMFDLQSNRVGYYDYAAFYQQNFDSSIRGEIINALRNNPGYKLAGGGYIATAQELARFGAAHFEAGFLSGSTFADVFTLQSTVAGEATPVGLGWRIDHDAAGRLRYHHAGSQQGARAILIVYPEQRLSVVVMSNLGSTPQDIMTPAASIAEAFFD